MGTPDKNNSYYLVGDANFVYSETCYG